MFYMFYMFYMLYGRIDLRAQISRTGVAVPVACRFDEYTPDIIENRYLDIGVVKPGQTSVGVLSLFNPSDVGIAWAVDCDNITENDVIVLSPPAGQVFLLLLFVVVFSMVDVCQTLNLFLTYFTMPRRSLRK